MRRITTRVALIAAVVLLGSSACGEADSGSSPDSRSNSALLDQDSSAKQIARVAPDSRFGVSYDYGTYFETVEQLQAGGTVLAGRIVAEARGVQTRDHEQVNTFRLLDVDVESVLAGEAPKKITIETIGWIADSKGEQRQADIEGVALEVGDRILAAVVNLGDRKRLFGFTNPQSVYILQEGQVVDTPRKDKLTKELEALTEEQLMEKVKKKGQ
jgi:hypothetical protein